MAEAKNKTIPEVVFTLNEAGVYVIEAARSKHGPRMSGGIDEYVQGVIAARYPDGLPEINPNFSELARYVNGVLGNKDTSIGRRFRKTFQKTEVPRETVRRAFLMLRDAQLKTFLS